MHILKARFTLKLLAVLPVGAKLVVQSALFRVFEHFIGFVDFLKLLLCQLVAGVEVGVVFAGQLFVSLGDLLGLRCALYSQKFVIILVRYCHDACSPSGRFLDVRPEYTSSRRLPNKSNAGPRIVNR